MKNVRKKEFQKFLKSIGGLESGWRCEPQKKLHPFRYYGFKFLEWFKVPERKNPFRLKIYSIDYFSIGSGWYPLVMDLITELIKLGWDKQVIQVKEKFGCYDSQTEVLTKRGWKFFKDCTDEDEFATLENGFLKYYKSTDNISYHYKGLMYRLETRGVDLLVTPNHNLYVAKGNYKGRFIKGNIKKHDYNLTIPNHVFNKPKRFLKSSKWVGVDFEKLKIEGYQYSNLYRNGKLRNYTKDDIEFSLIKILPFLGFYTAEGCSDPNKGDIRIAACNDGTNKAMKEQLDFEKVLIENGFEIKRNMEYRTAITYNIYNKVLAIWLANEFGMGALNKKIPDFIKELNPKLIELYLIWLYRGDGHKSKTAETLYTSSKQLADDVCELLLKAGFSFKINEFDAKSTDLIKSRNKRYSVRWLKKSNDFNIDHKLLKNENYVENWVNYDDMVYCVTVPNNTLFIRRNGKGVWCGNSLRFYIGLGSSEIFDVIYLYEKKSIEICEVCGEPGKPRSGGWIRTLCDEHNENKDSN